MEIEDKIWKVPTHDPLKYKKARKKKDLLGMALGIVLALSMTVNVFGIIGEGIGEENVIGNVTSENESLLGSGSQEAVIGGSRDVTNIRITSGTSERQPSWSPDSKYITYMVRSSGWQIKKVKLDDRSITTLSGGAGGIEPNWHPGNKVAFSRGTSDPTMDVYVMNSDGSGTKKLTSTYGYDEYPDWSPSGNKIAYVSQHGNPYGNKYISVMNADGTNRKNLGVVGIQPSWSPDGTKIAFKCYNGGANICIINADGSGLRRITSEGANTHEPDWSPNGQYIAYASKKDGDWEVYVIRPDGTGRRQLTSNSVDDNYPSWSPDGTKIAYSSFSSGKENIWVMSFDGSSTISPRISLTSPNGGESWARGTTKTITWTKDGNVGSYVKIDLYKGGLFKQTIASSTSNDGSHPWTIATGQTIGSDYKIKITSTSNSTYNDMSNNNFKIY